MPPRPPTFPQTYQYKSNDQPDKVAQTFNLTPTQLIQANPGGYPFSTGQTIKIPQIGPQLPAGNVGLTPSQAQNIPKGYIFPQPQKGTLPTTAAQTADSLRMQGVANVSIQAQIAAGVPPKMIPAGTGAAMMNPKNGLPMTPEDWNASGYTFDATSNSWRFNANTGLAQLAPPNGQSINGFSINTDPKNTDPRNTAAYQDYAANKVDFYDQKRWDPSAKGGKGDFVRIGDLIRQGKFDEKTGKAPVNKAYPNGKPGSGGGGAANVTKPAEAKQNANVNSVLNFNLGSG